MDEECTRCDGTGSLVNPIRLTLGGLSLPSLRPCPSCDGSGTVKR